MKNKIIKAYCPSCDIDNKGIEEKVEFQYIGIEKGNRMMNCQKDHKYDWNDIMKYQVERK